MRAVDTLMLRRRAYTISAIAVFSLLALSVRAAPIPLPSGFRWVDLASDAKAVAPIKQSLSFQGVKRIRKIGILLDSALVFASASEGASEDWEVYSVSTGGGRAAASGAWIPHGNCRLARF